MRIVKILNNNAVISRDTGGSAVVLMGTGIGFQRKPGESIRPAKNLQTFVLSDPEESATLIELLRSFPPEESEIVRESIAIIKEGLAKPPAPTIVLTLTDHLHQAITRVKNGEVLPNPLQPQIQSFYGPEFAIAKRVVNHIRTKHGIALPDEEIGYITLHIVNSENNRTTLQETVAVTSLVAEILALIKQFYDQPLDTDGDDYRRLIIHLQFFARRFIEQRDFTTTTVDISELVRTKFPEAYACATAIDAFLQQKKRRGIGEAEKGYLTIHIARLTTQPNH